MFRRNTLRSVKMYLEFTQETGRMLARACVPTVARLEFTYLN